MSHVKLAMQIICLTHSSVHWEQVPGLGRQQAAPLTCLQRGRWCHRCLPCHPPEWPLCPWRPPPAPCDPPRWPSCAPCEWGQSLRSTDLQWRSLWGERSFKTTLSSTQQLQSKLFQYQACCTKRSCHHICYCSQAINRRHYATLVSLQAAKLQPLI